MVPVAPVNAAVLLAASTKVPLPVLVSARLPPLLSAVLSVSVPLPPMVAALVMDNTTEAARDAEPVAVKAPTLAIPLPAISMVSLLANASPFRFSVPLLDTTVPLVASPKLVAVVILNVPSVMVSVPA